MSRKITFPMVGMIKGSHVWRNAETGVEIIKGAHFAQVGLYYVAVPTLGADARGVVTTATTLAEARSDAERVVATQREQIAAAHSDAITENAYRALAKHAPTEPCHTADADALIAEALAHTETQVPATVATIVGRIPLHARTGLVAQMIRYADTACTPFDAVKFAQAALDLYKAEGTVPADVVEPVRDGRGLYMGTGHVAPATIEAARIEALDEDAEREAFSQGYLWAQRHNLPSGRREHIRTAVERDYVEALREDWLRVRVAAAGKSWATHLAKFDGTILPRN